MSTLIRLIAACVLLLPVAAQSAAFEEGRHYLEVPFPQPVETGERIEVREFFWYGCPHCYTLEPALERWLRNKPKNAEFVRTPWKDPRGVTQGQAYYAFAAMGVLDKLHPALFRAVHAQGRRLDDEASIAQFVAEHGLDPAKFRAALNSFGVRLNWEKAKRLNETYGVNSVPLLVVDGKYITSPLMAGSAEAAVNVVDQLVLRAARERKR